MHPKIVVFASFLLAPALFFVSTTKAQPTVQAAQDIFRPPSGSSIDVKTQKRCNYYALIATAQNQVNIADYCSYSGGRWTNDGQYHFDWCINQSPGQLRSETQARQLLLDKCAP